ncbi:hypothetical protein [Spirochaeta cellobiosiphila]|uniref:GHMP family kinase ATP-binding protein n=1 Tax=Spirochaeta cellobiosiphila TaxID=504483 RepID=UPI00041FD30B|nr:hypothetical protein [Spirochaeta cellobiosiphila]
MNIKVPGNILIAGEYAVTLGGGYGLVAAVPTYGTLVSSASDHFQLISKFNGKAVNWKGESESLFTIIYEKAQTIYNVNLASEAVLIDTNDFSFPDGRKKGYGSSAVVAVLVSIYVLKDLLKSGQLGYDDIFSLALQGHRIFQGGTGSGYDIAASLYGGLGSFQGGIIPSFHPIESYYWPPCQILNGSNPVRTVSSMRLFCELQKKDSQYIETFFEQNQRLVSLMIENIASPKWVSILEEYKQLAVALGEKIGVPAEFSPMEKGWSKCLGAGNELALYFPEIVLNQLLSLSPSGAVWN